jgi:hypothetical protein
MREGVGEDVSGVSGSWVEPSVAEWESERV